MSAMDDFVRRELEAHVRLCCPPKIIKPSQPEDIRPVYEHLHTHGRTPKELKTQPFHAGWFPRFVSAGAEIARGIRRALRVLLSGVIR